jgi:integrase/recombinase XerD
VTRFLARPRFAARTRDSYAQDLAPLLAQISGQPVPALTHQAAARFLMAQAHVAASTFNRRLAALRSLVRWCQQQGWLEADPLAGVERRPQPRAGPRALDPEQVEAVLRGSRDPRDRALFWLIYDGGLRCQEALAINLEDIEWTERAIRIQGKGDRAREMFFSRRVSRYLDDYLQRHGAPTVGPLFITARGARSPRRPDGGRVRTAVVPPGRHALEAVHPGVGPAPAPPHRHQRPGGPGLQRGGAQALQRPPVAPECRGLHRRQPRGRQAQSARLGAPRHVRAVAGRSPRSADQRDPPLPPQPRSSWGPYTGFRVHCYSPPEFIPKGACWLNLQEAWWRQFRKAAFAGQTFADGEEIDLATTVATRQLNARAKPWVWTRPPPPQRHYRRRLTYLL